MRLNLARRGFCRSNLTRAKFKEKFEKDHSRFHNRTKFTPRPNNFKECQCRAILVYRRAIKAVQDATTYPVRYKQDRGIQRGKIDQI